LVTVPKTVKPGTIQLRSKGFSLKTSVRHMKSKGEKEKEENRVLIQVSLATEVSINQQP
jgi:hypothetical protein